LLPIKKETGDNHAKMVDQQLALEIHSSIPVSLMDFVLDASLNLEIVWLGTRFLHLLISCHNWVRIILYRKTTVIQESGWMHKLKLLSLDNLVELLQV